MAWQLPIRRLLDMRMLHGDRVALDLLELAAIGDTGIASTQSLIKKWRVTQSSVSRRIAALQNLGLVDVTPGYGEYQIHWTVLRG
jgi:DNA-binding IclR family transcriptional regulator